MEFYKKTAFILSILFNNINRMNERNPTEIHEERVGSRGNGRPRK